MKIKSNNEFRHYDGCKHNDPDNCGACALEDVTQSVPNYSAWPLAYMANRKVIPAKWKGAFIKEMNSHNLPYANNIRVHVKVCGVRFSDGTFTNEPKDLLCASN